MKNETPLGLCFFSLELQPHNRIRTGDPVARWVERIKKYVCLLWTSVVI